MDTFIDILKFILTLIATWAPYAAIVTLIFGAVALYMAWKTDNTEE